MDRLAGRAMAVLGPLAQVNTNRWDEWGPAGPVPRLGTPSAATSRRFRRSCRPKSSSAAVSCSTTSAQGQCQGSSEPQPSVAPSLSPVRASMDCLIKVTVCTRSFRTDGPRQNSRVQPVVATVVCANRKCLSNASAGVLQPRVLRGLVLRASATASRASVLWALRSVPFGKY